jgi:adenine-specific DNA-methyltransferase
MEIEGGGDRTFKGTLGGTITQTIVSPAMRFVNGRLSEPCTISAGWAMRSQILRWIDGQETVDTKGQRVQRFFFSRTGLLKYEKERTIENPKSVLRELGSTSDGGASMTTLGFPREAFDFPKPTGLVRRLVELVTAPDENDIVLDFFAGSGTTAHSVLEMNAADAGTRRFVLIQLPERTGRDDFPTIAEICKERVRRVLARMNEEDIGKLDLDGGAKQDRGFRVFKLAESNFETWEADGPKDAESLAKQLVLHVEHIRDGRTADDLIYEILLKSGFPLTTRVEKLTLAGKQVQSVAGGALLVCLERELTLSLIRAMAERKPERVVCLDAGFAGNDQLKANAVQIFRTSGVTSFKTV